MPAVEEGPVRGAVTPIFNVFAAASVEADCASMPEPARTRKNTGNPIAKDNNSFFIVPSSQQISHPSGLTRAWFFARGMRLWPFFIRPLP
jgi:hypothetical protein